MVMFPDISFVMTVSMVINSSERLGQHNDTKRRLSFAYAARTVTDHDRHCAPGQPLLLASRPGPAPFSI